MLDLSIQSGRDTATGGGYDPQHSNIPCLQVFVTQEPGKDNTEAAYITGRNQP